ncbi:molybdenum cofactor guanylyltransferase [Sporosarcina sp. 179-K 3D1 HS]|uniref:molybdenum cofactor guanylyltransferase n=1 Tax=Sporosarcina sp. 179-K 3D1 HS TaxID=3232169 RepID=UPI0039A2AAA5
MTKTVGIVLAGGLSRRFGSPKAFAELDGRPFYRIAMDAMAGLCDEVVIVTRPDLLQEFPAAATVIVDLEEFKGLGPLAGILSAMEFVEAARYVVLPCDMPYINRPVMEGLIRQHRSGVTAVRTEDRFHPLISIWERHLKGMLRTALAEQRLRVMEIMSSAGATWVDGNMLAHNEKRVFRNVNDPGLLERD